MKVNLVRESPGELQDHVLLVLAGLDHTAGGGWLLADLCWLWLGQLGPPEPGLLVSHPPAGEPKHFHLAMAEEKSRQAQQCMHFSSFCLDDIYEHPLAKTSHAAGPRVRILHRYMAQAWIQGGIKNWGC